MGLLTLLSAVALIGICNAATSTSCPPAVDTNRSITLLQEYLQINTTTYGNLNPGVKFWKRLARKLKLPIDVLEFEPGMPVLIIKWQGTDDSLPSILLNSHMDVVPTEPHLWSQPPFAANIVDGKLYARGSQDMKSVSIQYYEALYRLTRVNKIKLKRTFYMSIMPDEEIGGYYGMQSLLKSDYFQTMNVGCEMDEGGPFPIPAIPILYHDKTPWFVQYDCYGDGGHGSTFLNINDTAVGQCKKVMDLLFAFREEQYRIASKASINDAGGFTSVNLNKMNSGTANNVIPTHVSLVFDIRLAIHINVDEFESQLKQWAKEAGDRVEVSILLKTPQSAPTNLTDSNPYWVAIRDGVTSNGYQLLPTIPPGATDARHIRSDNISAFGFSPMPNTPFLLHMSDEYLKVDTFLKGIEIYEDILYNLGMLD